MHTLRSSSEKHKLVAVRTQKAKPAPKKTEQVEETEPVKSETDIVGLTDELLDEIDGLLQENAAEFVAAFVQKGGQ